MDIKSFEEQVDNAETLEEVQALQDSLDSENGGFLEKEPVEEDKDEVEQVEEEKEPESDESEKPDEEPEKEEPQKELSLEEQVAALKSENEKLKKHNESQRKFNARQSNEVGELRARNKELENDIAQWEAIAKENEAGGKFSEAELEEMYEDNPLEATKLTLQKEKFQEAQENIDAGKTLLEQQHNLEQNQAAILEIHPDFDPNLIVNVLERDGCTGDQISGFMDTLWEDPIRTHNIYIRGKMQAELDEKIAKIKELEDNLKNKPKNIRDKILNASKSSRVGTPITLTKGQDKITEDYVDALGDSDNDYEIIQELLKRNRIDE